MCVWRYMCTDVYSYEFICLVACYIISDSFVQSELGNERFRLVRVMDLTHWRFEDRLMRWFGDSYRFVQWRPDNDSDSRSRHFMWVFSFVLFPCLPWSIGVRILLVSFHVTIWYILLVWLPVSLHVISVSVHIIYLVDMSVYQHHFICSWSPHWFRISCSIPETELDPVIDLFVINLRI